MYEVSCIQKLKIHIAMINIKISYGPTDLWPSQHFQAHKNSQS
jgi:hypothetical protein